MRRPLDYVNPRDLLSHVVLPSPDSGILGQSVRFGLVGGLVTMIYLVSTILLADLRTTRRLISRKSPVLGGWPDPLSSVRPV